MSQSRIASKRILIVDDDVEVAEVMRIILGTKGYAVSVENDGQAGYDKLIASEPFDLAIFDLRMPGLSGMELCRRVRADERIAATPILVVSSLGSTMERPESFWTENLGADDFLSKPFDPLSLLGRVEYLLRKNQYRSLGGTRAPREVCSVDNFNPHDPLEVVRAFVESWNSMDFVCEFNTLSDEMLGGLTVNEYVQRRQQLWHDEGGESTRHNALDVNPVKATENVATVACLREDTIRGRTEVKDERYTLRRTTPGWKIVSVRSRPI